MRYMHRCIHGLSKTGMAWCVVFGLSMFACPAQAQQEEVLTFKGEGGTSIKVLDENGEVKEEINDDSIKNIVVAPKWSIPKTFEEEEPEEKSVGNAPKADRNPGERNKDIDDMLKLRKQKFRTSRAYVNRPPKKRS